MFGLNITPLPPPLPLLELFQKFIHFGSIARPLGPIEFLFEFRFIFFSKTSFVLLQEILAWKGRRRGSIGELEVDNVDMIEVLEEDDEVMVLEEHSENVEEGSDKLSRTESNKSFNSLGEEVFYWPFLW